MALTLTEQVKIINGIIVPTDTDTTFEQLVETQAYIEAINFKDTLKTFDAQAFPLAASYVEKVSNVVTVIFSLGGQIIKSLKLTLVTKGAPIAGGVPGTQTAWENFIETYTFSAIEYLAQITPEEKTEYESLP